MLADHGIGIVNRGRIKTLTLMAARFGSEKCQQWSMAGCIVGDGGYYKKASDRDVVLCW